MFNKKSLIIFLFFVLFDHTALGKENLSLMRMTPSGQEVTELSQIVFEFNKNMTELGNMEVQSEGFPITIKPAVNCKWRYLNTTTLACQLDKVDYLKNATRYDVKIEKGLKAQDGSVLKKTQSLFVETVRPEIDKNSVRFAKWHAEQIPVWSLKTRLDTTQESIAEHVFFLVGKKKIKANVSYKKCWNVCFDQFEISPEERLGSEVAYQIVFEKGIEPLVGSLTSIKEGVLAEAKTPGPFKFEGVRCTDEAGKTVLHTLDEMAKKTPNCSYYDSINLVFNTDVIQEKISNDISSLPALTVYDTMGMNDSVGLQRYQSGNVYTLTLHPNITNIFYEQLAKEIVFKFSVLDKKPNIEVTNLAVLEGQEKTDIIATVRNLKSLETSFLAQTGTADFKGTYTISGIDPDLKNIAYNVDMGVRDMLKNQTGMLQGSFIINPVLSNTHNFTVIVSNWQIVFKKSKLTSLAWVIDLKTGALIKGANVDVLEKDTNKVVASAVTDSSGIATFTNADVGDLVKVSKGQDVAFMPLKSAFRQYASYLSNWDFYSDSSFQEGLSTWGITPQGVYRQGEEVEYKIYVRQDDVRTFKEAPLASYQLKVEDPTGVIVFEQKEVTLSEFGSLSGKFSLPQKATSGYYNFILKHKDTLTTPMSFLVSDFKPSAFKVSTELNGSQFSSGQTADINSSATYYAGGAYAGGKVRQTATLSYAPFVYKGKGLEGIEFNFDQPLEGWEYREEILLDESNTLNEKGEFIYKFVLPESIKPVGNVVFETTVLDDGGRATSKGKTAKFFGRDRFVGLSSNVWRGQTNTPVDYYVVVAGQNDKLVKNIPVLVEFIQTQTSVVKEKTGGNAYVARYETKDVVIDTCTVESKTKPVKCTFIPKSGGSYQIKSSIQDTQKREHFVKQYLYVQGPEYSVWESQDDRLSFIMEKKEYQVGDMLEITIKNPLQQGTALITVERFGVITSFIQEFTKSLEKIKIPVTKDFFPGVYVSVSLFSPRVDLPMKERNDGWVDLGKPAQWGGYAKISVEDPYKQLQISVKTDKEDYRPREKVQVNIALKKRLSEPVEATVAVVDEAVLALLPKGVATFDPIKGFYVLKNLDVETYSLIESLVGRQKVEKKGANQGGDGGSNFAMRDVSKFVAYWNPSLKLDEKGRGNFEFTTPDNLTGWRILVIGVTPTDLFGLGQAQLKVSQPLEIRSLLPNQVRAGDKFTPQISVLNRAKISQTVVVTMQASGALKNLVIEEKKVKLNPFERQLVSFETLDAFLSPLQRTGQIEFSLKARAGQEYDGLVVQMPVLNLTTLQTAIQYQSSQEDKLEIPVKVAQSVAMYGGSVSMTIAPTLLSDLDKVVSYMQSYPYSCWEQQISRALVAASYVALRNTISADEIWEKADAFVKETLKKVSSYQAANGGMTYFEPKNDYVSVYLSAYTGYAFVLLKNMGYQIDPVVEDKLYAYLNDNFRNTKKGNQPYTVARIMSLPFLFSRINHQINSAEMGLIEDDISTMNVFEKAMLLKGLRVAKKFPKTAQKVEQSLFGMMNSSSGSVLFQNLDNNSWYQTLGSTARDNCAVLDAFTFGNDPQNKNDTVEKLGRAVLGLRTGNGSFGSTQSNAFCMTALASYAQMFEPGVVAMTVTGRLGDEKIVVGNFKSKSQSPVTNTLALGATQAGQTLTAFYTKSGVGKYYTRTVLSYPAIDDKPINSGLQVDRTFEIFKQGNFEELKQGDPIKQGDLVRVNLTVTNPVDRTFVVVSDPVLGALEPINKDLATASQFDANQAEIGSFWNGFYFQEIGHSAVNYYAESLRRGTYTLSYVAQSIANGVFQAFPAKVEAMYFPDVFGLSSSKVVTVDAP